MAAKGGSGALYTKERRGIAIENPFTLKMGQVFTGFGVGCGIGIGVGRPLNLGAIPVLNQVMIATRGATDAISGVQRHVNTSLQKVGAKNIQAGIGCGVGFGHGFGVGLAVKPSFLHQIQSKILELATHVVKKLGIDSGNQGLLPASLQTGKSMVNEASPEYQTGVFSTLMKSGSNGGNIIDGTTLVSPVGNLAPEKAVMNTEYNSRTEAVLNNFLKEEGSSLHGTMQLENNVLQRVLKHQVLIEELMQENEKLRQILVEELKVHPGKLESNFTSRIQHIIGTAILGAFIAG
ncbi:hypothetical protein ACS0TY_024296 [Phlomoides rotata]